MFWGFGRGFGWGRGFGRGWGFGRGFGWGAILGYCPWTGLPRGWRWWWPGYSYGMGYYPYGAYPYGTTYPYPGVTYPYTFAAGTGEVDYLREQARMIEEQLKNINQRIADLEKGNK